MPLAGCHHGSHTLHDLRQLGSPNKRGGLCEIYPNHIILVTLDESSTESNPGRRSSAGRTLLTLQPIFSNAHAWAWKLLTDSTSGSSPGSNSHSGGGSPFASLRFRRAFRLAVRVDLGLAMTLARCASALAMALCFGSGGLFLGSGGGM
jgi:hypothetical protein